MPPPTVKMRPDLVLAAVAHALHVGISSRQPLDERLGRYLRTRQILLLLDNFEHVLPAAPHLNRLLAVAPHLIGAGADVLWLRIAGLLAVVLVVGLLAATLAVLSTLRTPVLTALRRE